MKKPTKKPSKSKQITIKVRDLHGHTGVTKTITVTNKPTILHVVCGIEGLWEPSGEELSLIAGLFVEALEDPKGGVVATRPGVDATVIEME